MSYLNYQIEVCKVSIMGYKSALRAQYGILLLNIVICIIDYYELSLDSYSWILAGAFGCMFTNSLWVLTFIFEYKRTIRDEKLKLRYLEETKHREQIKKDAHLIDESIFMSGMGKPIDCCK